MQKYGEAKDTRRFIWWAFPEDQLFRRWRTTDFTRNINLADYKLLTMSHTRDATRKEIEDACAMLQESVLALHSMIANLSQDDLDAASGDNLEKLAKDGQCKVSMLKGSDAPRKPVYLVTFGNPSDADKHPPPDPLCLALKAANIFGIMSGMNMLGNAEDCCDDDIRDAMEEGRKHPSSGSNKQIDQCIGRISREDWASPMDVVLTPNIRRLRSIDEPPRR